MASFFFYDLETSGTNPRKDRIMQFAGQRTDMNLKPVGEPVNLLIKMTEDTLPEPDAVLIHGTTPQQTVADGVTEAEFVKFFNSEILKPDTIFVGFNSIRFDDEFMRFLFYRNFNDAYEWQWKNGCSRWDLLDVTRMTRSLRPDGIKWPFAPDGKPSNRLELLSGINKLDHADAHDALSDVNATIAVARLVRQKQPKLFDYLLNLRNKKTVQSLVESNKIFVYSSGKYPGEFEKTAIVVNLCPHPDKNGILVYDLRYDPGEYIKMSPEQLVDKWKYKKDSDEPRLPVKSLQFNRCPAIAPMSVLDDASKKRLNIDPKLIDKYSAALKSSSTFKENLLKAIGIINASREQVGFVADDYDADSRLYDDFIPDKDKNLSAKLRSAKPEDISLFAAKFSDERLKSIIPLYKARNFPKFLTDTERSIWDDYRQRLLLGGKESSRLAKFMARMQEVAKRPGLSKDQQYLLEELQLWAENIMPEMDE
jgi:exodeoxyribonuclease-1